MTKGVIMTTKSASDPTLNGRCADLFDTQYPCCDNRICWAFLGCKPRLLKNPQAKGDTQTPELFAEDHALFPTFVECF